MHFLQLQGYYDICAGLYTFAVEEWKALSFKRRFPILRDNKIKFLFRPHNSGFLDHNDKLSAHYQHRLILPRSFMKYILKRRL
jgi:hypothetical protein